MKHVPVLLLFALIGWFGSWSTNLLAQEPPRSPLTPPSEETTLNPGEPPTPQFLQVGMDVGAQGLSFQVRVHPAWLALFRPQVRVGQARTIPPFETETAPPFEGSADQLHEALEQALNRAQSTVPSP